jgi:hypothetical protein
MSIDLSVQLFRPYDCLFRQFDRLDLFERIRQIEANLPVGECTSDSGRRDPGTVNVRFR